MDKEQWLPSEQAVKFFEENGYWVAPKIITDKRLERLRESMALVHNEQFETGRTPWEGYWRPGDKSRLRKSDNTHWSDLTLRELANDQVIGQIAATLMRTEVIRLWHDQLLYKPGDEPGQEETANVGWHQDYKYWQAAATPSLLTAWVAFDDVDLNNGCMQVIKGSSHWGLININDFFEQDLSRQQAKMNIPEGYKWEPVPLVMKAGQVSFHHCMTIHGSGPNRTDQPRRSLAIHLMTGDTRYRAGTEADWHMNVKLLQPQDGDLFAGEWFPVLYASNASSLSHTV